jgi:hypothetical protein
MSPVQTLYRHAAALCNFAQNLPLRRNHYELSVLERPGNHRAPYGLAKVSLQEGQTGACDALCEAELRCDQLE